MALANVAAKKIETNMARGYLLPERISHGRTILGF